MATSPETTRRPIMGAREIAKHQINQHGRYHGLADDGYDDMELAGKAGWTTISAWGRDGWDLGEWPYVSIQVRRRDGRFELQQIVEGDHTAYAFDTEEDLEAAIDYLFLWYAASKDWAPLTWEDRERLDQGGFEVDDKWRGGFSWERADRERES